MTNCADSVDLDLIDREAAVFDEGGLVVGNVSCSITVRVISHLRNMSACHRPID
jgi:hypothetical protein